VTFVVKKMQDTLIKNKNPGGFEETARKKTQMMKKNILNTEVSIFSSRIHHLMLYLL